jgi:hypothetical protein
MLNRLARRTGCNTLPRIPESVLVRRMHQLVEVRVDEVHRVIAEETLNRCTDKEKRVFLRGCVEEVGDVLCHQSQAALGSVQSLLG